MKEVIKDSGIFVAFLLVTELYCVVRTTPEFLKELLRCLTREGMEVRDIEVFKWL